MYFLKYIDTYYYLFFFFFFFFLLVKYIVLLALIAVIVFAIVTDGIRGGYRVTNGISFYLELFNLALSIGLFVLALYDVLLSRKPGGDPTMGPDPNAPAVTFNNPGFREGGRNGKQKLFLQLKKNLIGKIS